ncbi:MAG: hypothetical protein AAFY26_27770, partial [Cyanobacteria bacterium J06638_22]
MIAQQSLSGLRGESGAARHLGSVAAAARLGRINLSSARYFYLQEFLPVEELTPAAQVSAAARQLHYHADSLSRQATHYHDQNTPQALARENGVRTALKAITDQYGSLQTLERAADYGESGAARHLGSVA